MSPTEHLDWFDDNNEWFASLPTDQYELPLPSCPGWNVNKVITHLTIGVGIGYAFSLATPETQLDGPRWTEMQVPATEPHGKEARDAFVTHMGECAALFRRTAPTAACWTYSGPGQASFWFRRAAIETTLHRFDAAEAVGQSVSMPIDRAVDAVGETVGFALPFAANLVQHPSGSLLVRLSDTADEFVLGAGDVVAQVEGTGQQVLSALWGRNKTHVDTTGNTAVAAEWLSLVEAAFPGR